MRCKSKRLYSRGEFLELKFNVPRLLRAATIEVETKSGSDIEWFQDNNDQSIADVENRDDHVLRFIRNEEFIETL